MFPLTCLHGSSLNAKTMYSDVRVLVIGAGALGCELLSQLAMTGFKNIVVVDMDTIELSNLSRHSLGRHTNIGSSKALVSAASISKRFSIKCIGLDKRIEEMSTSFFADFNVIFCAVDTVETRMWINGIVHELRKHVILIDTGTEGWMGHVRLAIPGIKGCLFCTRNLYLADDGINLMPLCTLKGRPSKPEHCVDWALSIAWPRHNTHEFDPHNSNDLEVLHQLASNFAKEHGICSVTCDFVRDYVVRIIPGIISTTTMVAGLAVLVAQRALSSQFDGDNFWFINGQASLNWTSMSLDNNPDCIVCGSK